MRFSKLYCPTLKETPRDAEVVSHQLMMRAGLVRKVASGVYTLLPLGQKIIKKFEAIVRNEMNKADAQEITMPMVVPSELWKESGRWDKYGKELLRITDRHEHESCLGPTHEEVVTDLIRHEVKSYKQLPLNLYQIQTKFRDEIRPRFGLMRGREFIMKDAYSFHATVEDLEREYQVMMKTYHAIFKACGLNAKKVEADNGSMGGSGSAEFMITADTGEDEIFYCQTCDFAANYELYEGKDKTAVVCPNCKTRLLTQRGIEVGHIFKLGTRYSESMNAQFTDEAGQIRPMEMGCYGIGIGRTVAAAIEQNHDEKGIKWPKALAPFDAVIIISTLKDPDIVKAAEMLYTTCKSHTIDVLLDDRDSSLGAKFKDAELIGIPYQIVVGKTWKETKAFELINRVNGEKHTVKLEELMGCLRT